MAKRSEYPRDIRFGVRCPICECIDLSIIYGLTKSTSDEHATAPVNALLCETCGNIFVIK